jgi:hypothetical protein
LYINGEEEEMTDLARKALVVTAVAATALGVAGGTAGATQTINVPSKVSIKSNGLHFSGKVTVPPGSEPCRQLRKVVLFKVVSGGPDQAVGHDTTGNDGKWSITPQGSAGITLAHFYAKAKKRSDGAAGTIHVCLPAKSKVIGVSP